jgi:glycerol-3-phosphate acyltransferase PlsY
VPILAYILTALAAYLLGSIPTGYLVGRAKGVDIRSVGSGNIGATNVFRFLGRPAGIFVLFVDALKGFGAVALVVNFHPELSEFAPAVFGQGHQPDASVREGLGIVAGIAAILGHNYTCWLRFKGGKGIATSAGVYLALAPAAVGLALAAWILLFVITRYVSLASIAAAVALPAAVWFTEDSLALGVVTTGLGVMAIYKHKSNIQRLLAGTESRIHFKQKEESR